MMSNRLPEKLTALRKHFGYSQGDLAAKLGITVAEYMNWENGNSVCSIFQLKELASLYGVPLQDLADNARTVVLPRLDTAYDSVDIPFVQDQQADDGNAADYRYAQSSQPSGYSQRRSESGFQATRVNRIVDDDTKQAQYVDDSQEEEYDDEDDDSYEDDESEKKEGFFSDKKHIGLVAAIAAAVVLLIVVVRLLAGGGSSSASVSLSDDNRIALGKSFSVYLRGKGDAVSMGSMPSIDTSDLVQVSASDSTLLGLKSDGTVVTSGSNDVSDWSDIVYIAQAEDHSVGVKSDGTVVCSGSTGCNVDSWTNVEKVYAGNGYTLGLKSDGTLNVAGTVDAADDLRSLGNVKDVAAGDTQIAVLENDGSVETYSVTGGATSDTSTWPSMRQAAAGSSFAAGLSSDGTVTVASTDESLTSEAEALTGIRYIAARGNTLVAADSSGAITGAGDNSADVFIRQSAEESAEASSTPTAAPTATPEEKKEKLSAVTGLETSQTAANITITWNAVDHADYYVVTINTDPVTSLQTQKNSASIGTDKLTGGQDYTISVTASSNDSSYADSDPATVSYSYTMTKIATPKVTVRQEANTNILDVSWEKVTNAAYYRVYYPDTSTYQDITGTSCKIDLSNYDVKNAQVEVVAYPADMYRYAASDATYVSFEYVAPTAKLASPADISWKDNGDDTFTVTWSAVENAGSYAITYSGTGGGGDFTTSDTKYTSGQLRTGTYTVTITAVPTDTTKYSSSDAASATVTITNGTNSSDSSQG